MATQEYSFKAFSEHDFYRRVNRWLVDRVGLQRGWTVVDVACGSGAVTELILERIRGARDAMVVGLDMSGSALRDAAAKVAGVRDALVEFVQARAEEMSRTVRRAADAVIFCNGIHYIGDKRRLLREVHLTLRPGGIFAFNTSFFEGAQPPETRRFYRHWMIKCLRKLKQEHNLTPSRDKVEARHQLAPEDYRALLEESGFEIREEELVAAPVTREGWLDISRFSDFIAGALPGISIETASQVLCEGLQETFDELQIDEVPRNWLAVVAVRP